MAGPGSTANGHTTHVPTSNGRAGPITKKSPANPKAKKSVIKSSASNLLRILLWSTIAYVLFQCPSSPSELTDDSSDVCKQYVNLRTRVAPHVKPHYDTYIQPYVQKAAPHVDRFNIQVYQPASSFVVDRYNVYAAPRVSQAQQAGLEQWEAVIYPKIQNVREWASAQYNVALSPHIQKVVDVSDPYINKAKDELQDVYDGTLIPVYQKTAPLAQAAYQRANHVAVDVAYPYFDRARVVTSALLARRVWPVIITLYGENVEPQVTRIIERLARYKDSRKLKAAISKDNKASSITSAVSHASSVVSAEASTTSSNISESVSSATSQVAHQAKDSEADIRKKIDADLKQWQEKFARAADRGSEDLKQRVGEITDRQINVQAHQVGQSLIVQLEETIKSSTSELKDLINSQVAKLGDEASSADEALIVKEVQTSIKSTGEKIRNKAMAVKKWKKSYDDETSLLVSAALNSTLEVVDNIRDLGLQEIGMRWAYMEGVTYKDWSMYHDLKKSFDQWRNAVQAVVSDHANLSKAKSEGDAVQEKALNLAGDAAKELIRLQSVAAWKVSEHDASDDFGTKSAPQRIAKAARQALSQGSESISSILAHASEQVKEDIHSVDPESASSLTESLKSAATSASSQVSEASVATPGSPSEATDLSPAAASKGDESVASQVADAASSDSSIVLEDIISTTKAVEEKPTPRIWGGAAAASVAGKQVVLDEDFDDSWSESISSILEAAGDRASDLTSAISQALLQATKTQGTVESVTSLASKQYAEALLAASSIIYGTPQPVGQSLSSVASEQYAAAVTAASYAIYGTSQPILDSLSSQAGSAYGPVAASASSLLSSISAAASVQLSQGLSAASAQYTDAKIAVGAQPAPLHQQYLSDAQKKYYEGIGLAHDQYSRFVGAASTAVYGTPTPAYQSLASVASDKIYGTPIPAYESMLSAAKQQYTDALSAASISLASVQVSASSMLGMSKDSPGKQLLSSASAQYDAAYTTASEGLAYAASVASVKFYGSETGTFESLSSAVSEGIVGKETPWNEAAISKASANFDALLAKASEQIYGSPTPVPASVWSQAGDYASQATDAASFRYAQVRDVVSELLVGREPDFTESVLGRLSSAYYTGAFAAAVSASSFASEAYGSASSVAGQAYDSASSVVSSVFTPPAALEGLIETANQQLQDAVSAASAQIYGSSKGTIESASSAAAGAYSSAQSAASEAIYGTQPSYLEAAQISLAALASDGQRAASDLIYGTPTGVVEGATASAASAYTQVASAISENLSAAGDAVKDTYASVSSQVSYAVYGPQDGTWESASSRISVAAASASAQIAKMMADASSAAADSVDGAASAASSVASKVTGRVKDEL